MDEENATDDPGFVDEVMRRMKDMESPSRVYLLAVLKQAYLMWRDSRRQYKRVMRELNLRPAWVSMMYIRWHRVQIELQRHRYLVVAVLIMLLVALVVEVNR